MTRQPWMTTEANATDLDSWVVAHRFLGCARCGRQDAGLCECDRPFIPVGEPEFETIGDRP